MKHDHKLQFPQITMPMYSEDDPIETNLKQSHIDGIMVPLFRFNNLTIPFHMVNQMTLSCNPIPSIEVTITDHFNLINTLQIPGQDNILYVQIIPPFDNAYKKIQLPFHITHSGIYGNTVTLSGTYYIPGINNGVMKPYGMISTYDLFEQVAQEYGLGYCSNVDGSEDERYIYNDNRTPINFLNREIRFSGSDGHVYDWWIDFWNNINFVDIQSEYKEKLSDKDMMIWTLASNGDEADQDSSNEPMQMVALFSNIYNISTNDMYISGYTPILNSIPVTDTNFEVFKINEDDRSSTLIQDGDVHNEILIGYSYGGEVFGDHDYLTQQRMRGIYFNKINSNAIEVIIHRPILSLMKGGHVNLWWYDISNDAVTNLDTDSVPTNIDTPKNIQIGDENYTINKTISGQYYIMDVVYKYLNGVWDVVYTLSRPQDEIHRPNEVSKETFME